MNTEKKYYNIKDACEIKGLKYNSIRLQEFRQPNCGVPDKRIRRADGKITKYWKLDTINEWIDIFDDELPEYLFKNMRDKEIGYHVKAIFLDLSRQGRVPGWLTVELEHLQKRKK